MATINSLLVVAVFLPAGGAQPAPRSVDGNRIAVLATQSVTKEHQELRTSKRYALFFRLCFCI